MKNVINRVIIDMIISCHAKEPIVVPVFNEYNDEFVCYVEEPRSTADIRNAAMNRAKLTRAMQDDDLPF